MLIDSLNLFYCQWYTNAVTDVLQLFLFLGFQEKLTVITRKARSSNNRLESAAHELPFQPCTGFGFRLISHS